MIYSQPWPSKILKNIKEQPLLGPFFRKSGIKLAQEQVLDTESICCRVKRLLGIFLALFVACFKSLFMHVKVLLCTDSRSCPVQSPSHFIHIKRRFYCPSYSSLTFALLDLADFFLIHLEQPNLQSKSISCDFLSACPLGDLNLASVDGHKASAFFCPRGKKKLTASKPSSFFFSLSEAVECVCTM